MTEDLRRTGLASDSAMEDTTAIAREGTSVLWPAHARLRSPRGMGYAAAGFAVAVLLSSTLVAGWLALSGSTTAGLGALALGQLGLWVGLGGAPILASRRQGAGTLAADFGLRAHPRDLGGVAIGVVTQVAAVPALYWVVEQFTGALDVAGPARELTDRFQGVGFVVLAVLVVGVAPVVEELFYRGLLLRTAERRWGSTTAVLVSSAVFGASHFQLIQFPALFGFGVVLAVLTLRSGRLGPAIAAHMAFNAVTIIAIAMTR